MSILTPELFIKLHKPAPRYTSYPTAPEWGPLPSGLYAEKLEELSRYDVPLSLYLHIPFCQTMCLFCGCSVILNRKAENEERYVQYLLKEIALVSQYLKKRARVNQIHFGGGTPTQLTESLLGSLFEGLKQYFTVDFTKEIAIEIDPRTVVQDQGRKLRFLRQLGFNRVSFGVQDTDPRVQEAVKRHQSFEITRETFQLAKALGFQGINLDLIYGLPYQTEKTFQKTIEDILSLRPDRIALFSYAKVPWLKSHQKAIRDEALPSAKEKFSIYTMARHALLSANYVGIGMDHFSLPDDELAKSYFQKTLQRNFQGYTLRLAEDMLGFGVTSIGFARQAYIQNLKELPAYYASLDKEELPIHRGKILSHEDRLRKWVIHTLMCNFELDKVLFENRFGIPFDSYFRETQSTLESLEKDSLLTNTSEKITATPLGELFIRNIAMTFDAYLKEETSSQPKFSQSI